MAWRDIPTEFRANRRCATEGCREMPVAHFEHGDVGSDYCSDCADRIERMRIRAEESNRQIDELEAAFAENPSIT